MKIVRCVLSCLPKEDKYDNRLESKNDQTHDATGSGRLDCRRGGSNQGTFIVTVDTASLLRAAELQSSHSTQKTWDENF